MSCRPRNIIWGRTCGWVVFAPRRRTLLRMGGSAYLGASSPQTCRECSVLAGTQGGTCGHDQEQLRPFMRPKPKALSHLLLPGDAPRFEARRHPPEHWGELSCVLNPNATGASVFADHHTTAVEEIDHSGDRLTTVAGAGSHDGDQFAEGVFCAVDFFVDIFHGSFYLLFLTA